MLLEPYLFRFLLPNVALQFPEQLSGAFHFEERIQEHFNWIAGCVEDFIRTYCPQLLEQALRM